MNRYEVAFRSASAALRTLSSTESKEEAEQAERVLNEAHLPALVELDPVIAAGVYGLMFDLLRARACRHPVTPHRGEAVAMVREEHALAP